MWCQVRSQLPGPVELLRFPDREDQATGPLISQYLKQELELDPIAVHLLFAANRHAVRWGCESCCLTDPVPVQQKAAQGAQRLMRAGSCCLAEQAWAVVCVASSPAAEEVPMLVSICCRCCCWGTVSPTALPLRPHP